MVGIKSLLQALCVILPTLPSLHPPLEASLRLAPGRDVATAGCHIAVLNTRARKPVRMSVTWSGPCVDGLAEGRGTAIIGKESGVAEFQGVMHSGIADGYGRYFLPDGTAFTGQWRRGEFGGLVIRTDAGGSRYIGFWGRNGREGWGVEQAASGWFHAGHWAADQRDGYGLTVSDHAAWYVGRFCQDRSEGFGILRSLDKDEVFVGTLLHGRKNGHGVYLWPDRSRFAGRWRDDLPNGIGKLTDANGRTVEGVWSNGCMKHGNEQMALFVDKQVCP